MMTKLIAIVAGSRYWVDRNSVFAALDAIAPDLLIHGSVGRRSALAITGTDLIAQQWAQQHGIAMLVVPPLWETKGSAAGSSRNALMLWTGQSLSKTCGARLVVAALPGFYGGNGGLVEVARASAVEVVDCSVQSKTSGGTRWLP